MEYTSKLFVAYSKKLLRALVKIRMCLSEGVSNEALQLLDELISDTKGDTEA